MIASSFLEWWSVPGEGAVHHKNVEAKTMETKTPVEKFNDADEEEQKVLVKLFTRLEMADPIVSGFVEKRRNNYVNMLPIDDADLQEGDTVEGLMEDREDDFIEEFGYDEGGELFFPEWFLRIEAQDVIMGTIVDRLKED